MNIAISAAGPKLDSPVFDEFRNTPFLLIVNVETMDCTSIPHVPQPESDQELATKILELDCEALITGTIDTAAFNILANNAVTRYNGVGFTAGASLEAMEARQLKFIRNPEGTDECHGNPPELEDLRTCDEHRHH
ncbi:MAG: hypothetical protein EOL86_05965 [Deltaproteobacteria bacterium]|nr:hypothetical protein [Deltaproteobacteria bacterium]